MTEAKTAEMGTYLVGVVVFTATLALVGAAKIAHDAELYDTSILLGGMAMAVFIGGVVTLLPTGRRES